MSSSLTARLCAVPTLAAVTLVAATPAAAHVTVTPSAAAAGSATVLSVAISHGCDGSPTTGLEVAIPEQVLSVSATRSPFWKAEPRIVPLDEPATDAHGNEVTERVQSVVFTATTPLPDGVRDAVELAFTVPDVPGETLAFPTIQTCAEGETAWVEVPENGQEPEELESPAPAFEVLPASGAGHGSTEPDTGSDAGSDAGPDAGPDAGSDTGSDAGPVASAGSGDGQDAAASKGEALGWAGLGTGGLALVLAGVALARSRRTA